jgi:hypothetical protein
MQESHPQQQELDPVPNSLAQSASLAERLDPAIGEATSVLGAVVTELMRRSLRGGVLRIGEELNGYVGEQVDLVIADRTPVLEQVASTVADKIARLAATEVATEEVRAVEQRTAESSRQLTVQIEATRDDARQSTAEAARDLAARIADAEKQALEKTMATAQELTGKIAETEKRMVEDADARLGEQARGLTTQIEERGKQTLEAAEARLAAEARERAQQIETAEKRVENAVRAEFSSQIEALIQRSRVGSDRLKIRLAALDEALAHLGKKQDLAHLDMTHSLERTHGDLRTQIAALVQANEALRARVAELERPRGLRALFLRLFGMRKKVRGG